MLQSSPVWESSKSIHFLHNWRCAGSSFNSLLSSNFHHSFLKIGTAFNSFGWPNTVTQPLETLRNLREAQTNLKSQGAIISGHLFVGLESSISGDWDIWMNAREPMSRLVSGLMRFHNANLKPKKHEKNHLMKVMSAVDLSNPLDVDELLNTTLKRESNGLCKRLAAYSLTSNPNIPLDAELERLPFLETEEYDNKSLFETARTNLDRIRLIILPQWLNISCLCIEKVYELEKPLINPFSILKHNSVELGGSNYNDDSRLTDYCGDVLKNHTQADIKLWPYIHKKFTRQVNELGISKEELKVRQLIHETALFSPKWFPEISNEVSDEKAFNCITTSLAKRYIKVGDLGDKLLSTVLNWNRFDPVLADRLRHAVLQKI